MMADKCMCKKESQADTYIEKRFEELCAEHKEAEMILNQWRTDKAVFSSKTAMTGFDFQHYSMHDKSHSIEILRNIEMILGRERVDMLGAGDLWLLLESAYVHDIGMSVTYEELCDVWQEKEFSDFVMRSLYTEAVDVRKASVIYKNMCDLMKARDIFNKKPEDYDWDEFRTEIDDILDKKYWPVICERYIMLLYTEYIRQKHPERSRVFVLSYGREEERNIPDRMYVPVANIALLHSCDFDEIFKKAPYKENSFGFEAGQMHPQFAAAMLRIGDLLDMDSNRFNVNMMNHMGLIPLESRLHLEKHKAITSLSYTESGISAEAKSDKFEVCKTTNQWFRWIEEEVNNLICCWNQIVPEKLHGCRLNRCSLRIYYKGQLFDASKETRFSAESSRVYKMLIGENIYRSRLTFIREYLQNAIDASKMKLWIDIKEEKPWGKYTAQTFTPFDLELSWFERFAIDVEADIDWDKSIILLSFQDYGIGMEKECVAALSNVAGDSWRKRSSYAAEIPKMPLWLRPTGGFGIGVQSAFMITDHVEFITCSEKENIGRKICLDSNKRGGRVSEFLDKTAVKGTRVQMKISLLEFINEVARNGQGIAVRGNEENIYDRNEASKIILAILKAYISRVARYSLFPIRIRCDKEKKEEVGMGWTENGTDSKRMITPLDRSKKGKLTAGNDWNIRYAVYGGEMVVWDYKNGAMVTYHLNKRLRAADCCYYKGILVGDMVVASDSEYSLEIDYFSDHVGRYLTVSREEFKMEYKEKCMKDRQQYRYLFAALLAEAASLGQWEDALLEKTAKQALILKKTGCIKMTEKEYGNLLKKGVQYIKVKRVDDKILALDRQEFTQRLTDFLFDGRDIQQAFDYMRECMMIRDDYISMESLMKDIGSRNEILYEGIHRSRNYIRMRTFADKLMEHKNLLDDGKEPEWKTVDDKICRALVQKDAYIISDTDISEALEWTEGDGKYFLRAEGKNSELEIVCWSKRKTNNTVRGYNVRKFICNLLEEKINSGYKFPIILCTHNIKKEDRAYGVWVSAVFCDTQVFSLEKEGDAISDGRETAGLNYLLLPLSETAWHGVMKEREDRGITKDRYDEMVKGKGELRFLVEWTYLHQLNEPRLKMSEIQEKYEQLLDLIYKWIFE